LNRFVFFVSFVVLLFQVLESVNESQQVGEAGKTVIAAL